MIFFSFLTGVAAQTLTQQSFRVKPEPVEVKLGGQAVLRCEVENQAGRAQWTKDGFALGKCSKITYILYNNFPTDAIGLLHKVKVVCTKHP